MFVGRSIAGGFNSNALTNNYLIVGSRTFAQTQAALADDTTPGTINLLPPQTENTLRQTRWQKTMYPTTTKTAIRVGFYPYTMVTTGGPAYSEETQYSYQRIWEARRWMPITWAGAGQSSTSGGPTSNSARALAFYGPYMVCDLQAVDATNTESSGEISPSFNESCNVQLIIWVQFSGQR